MDDFISIVSQISDVGLPLIVSILFIFVIIKLIPDITSGVKSYYKKREDLLENQNRREEESDKKYQEFLVTLTKLSDQQNKNSEISNEVIKRSNEVIERNNIILRDIQSSNNNLCDTIKSFVTEARRLQDTFDDIEDREREILYKIDKGD